MLIAARYKLILMKSIRYAILHLTPINAQS